MTVPAAKVRSLCTSAEVALVRASRKPELEQLSQAAAKRLALRARKLFDKWQDLSRGQSRARARQVGASAVDENTALKVQIFRDALTSFETKLAKCEASLASAAKKPRPKTKIDRAVEHRASRAAIRKGMTAVEDLLKSNKTKKKKSH